MDGKKKNGKGNRHGYEIQSKCQSMKLTIIKNDLIMEKLIRFSRKQE